MKETAEKYLEHLEKIFKVQPKYMKFSEDCEFPPFHLLGYQDIPERGMITGITSGMSFVPDPRNENIRQELLITVESEDPSWMLAVADIGYQNRGYRSFLPGQTIKHHGAISEESAMTSFLVWHQATVREDFEVVCLPEWHVKFMGLFPIYDDEADLIKKHGPDWLFELVSDPCDVKRESVASQFRVIH